MGNQPLNTYHIRLEAWLIFPLKQFAPIDVGEEMVSLDFGRTIGTQAALRITIQQARQQIASGGRNNVLAWEGQGLLQNFAVHLIGVLVIEWR